MGHLPKLQSFKSKWGAGKDDNVIRKHMKRIKNIKGTNGYIMGVSETEKGRSRPPT